MPHFFDLPRELRDMIYLAVITWSRPRPQLTGTTTRCLFFGLEKEWSSESDFGQHPQKPATTCANLLATNRQINAELVHAIERARKKGLLVARLDHANGDGFYHAFRWLSVPIVQTSSVQLHSVPKWEAGSWKRNVPVVRHLFSAPQRKLSTCRCTMTTIEQLQIDIRLLGKQPDSPMNGIMCANVIRDMLKGLVGGKDMAGNCSNEVTIDTLVLNVVSAPQPGVSTEASGGDTTSTNDDPHAVAKSLLDMWNKLWSGVEYLNGTYCVLLERIQRVRVCVDGVLVRKRELRLELERGQAERKRIALRVGW